MAGKTNRNLKFLHNTVASSKGFALRIASLTGIGVVSNNIFINDASGSGAIQNNGQTGITWNSSSFLFSFPTQPLLDNGYLGSVHSGAADTGFSVLSSDELFVNPSSGNFFPKAGANIIGAGEQLGLAYDFNGLARSGCSPTVGAHEYSSSQDASSFEFGSSIKALKGSLQCSLTPGCDITCNSVCSSSHFFIQFCSLLTYFNAFRTSFFFLGHSSDSLLTQSPQSLPSEPTSTSASSPESLSSEPSSTPAFNLPTSSIQESPTQSPGNNPNTDTPSSGIGASPTSGSETPPALISGAGRLFSGLCLILCVLLL